MPPADPFPTASGVAREVDTVMLIALSVSVVFTIGIFATITVFVIRYRRRPSDDVPRQIRGSIPLETIWALVPLAINIGLFALGAPLFARIIAPPEDADTVYVVGKQWMWKVEHPDGRREIDALTVPLGRPVRLLMTSQDVIHSFFVPAFRVKADVYPDRYSWLWFEADALGDFPLYCAEYCGTGHSAMIGTVHVVPADDYDAWAAGGGEGTMAARGEQLFRELGCIACHKSARDAAGPSLVGLYGSSVQLAGGTRAEVDEGYLRRAILEPQRVVRGAWEVGMPTFEGRLDEADLFALVEYLKRIGEE